MAQITSSTRQLLRLTSAQLLPIQQLSGFLSEIRRLSVSKNAIPPELIFLESLKDSDVCFTTVLAINDKSMLPVKIVPTLFP
jgi:hypothetical protein